MSDYIDKNCLSYWFPVLRDAGIPVPRTTVIRLADDCGSLCGMIEGNPDKPDPPAYKTLDWFVQAAAHELGYPCFLRTGHTAAKHSWDRSCCLRAAKHIRDHILTLVEFSECCDFLGLPYRVWAVREMLPTRPLFHCARYGYFPVVREYRFFIRDGAVVCHHPYWPMEALEQGEPDAANWRKLAGVIAQEPPAECVELAARVAPLFEGWWSVDILETDCGWFVTDMAEGERSWHWDGCPHDDREKQGS